MDECFNNGFHCCAFRVAFIDCFNAKKNSLEIIVEHLKKAINEEQNLKIMYDFFKLISIN